METEYIINIRFDCPSSDLSEWQREDSFDEAKGVAELWINRPILQDNTAMEITIEKHVNSTEEVFHWRRGRRAKQEG